MNSCNDISDHLNDEDADGEQRDEQKRTEEGAEAPVAQHAFLRATPIVDDDCEALAQPLGRHALHATPIVDDDCDSFDDLDMPRETDADADAAGPDAPDSDAQIRRPLQLPEIHVGKEAATGAQPPSQAANAQTRTASPLRTTFVTLAVLVAGAFAALLCLMTTSNLYGTATSTSTDATIALEETVERIEFAPSISALDEIPAGDGVQTFSLSNADAPELSDEQLAAIEDAIASIEEVADVGFVFYDLDTGRGICYNADTAVYGASTIKAPYALFICEELVEGGIVSLDDTTTALIEAAIVNSDNSSYTTLCKMYDDYGFNEWAASLGATDAEHETGDWYPWYCARSSAKLWTEMYLYLQTGTDTATWLEGLLGQTTTSFIRDGIEDTGATVLNKAGWIAYSDDYNSVSDAAIIELDGHTYILSVMTYMPYDTDTRALHSALSAAIFDARDAILSENGLV